MFCQTDYYYVFDSFDYLRIENDKQQIVGTYCGKKTGKEVFLPGDQVSIIFHSDNAVGGRGFQLYFTAVPHGNWYFFFLDLQCLKCCDYGLSSSYYYYMANWSKMKKTILIGF